MDKKEFFMGAGLVALGVLVGIFVALSLQLLQSAGLYLGGASPGTKATIATTTEYSIGTTATIAFATSTCTSRVVSTKGSAILLTFSNLKGERPDANTGFPQGASTTVAYDAEIYGCDAVYIYSNATQNVNVMEMR